MERLKRRSRGMSLFELVIAITLFTIVLLATSSLLINFGRFSFSTVKSDASLMGTALGTFEEIVSRIRVSNQVIIPAAGFPASSIDIRVSPGPASSVHTNDIRHVYWMENGQLRYMSSVGVAPVFVAGGGTLIARDITSFLPSMIGTDTNRFKLILAATAQDGSEEYLETTAVARSRSANLP